MNNVSPRLKIVFVLITALMLGGGGWYYHSQGRLIKHEVENNLEAIAKLKVNQIVEWRAERLADAAVLSESPILTEAISQWMIDRQASDTDLLLARFNSLKKNYHYYDIAIVDTDCKPLLSLTGETEPLNPKAIDAVKIAFLKRRPILTDLHTWSGDNRMHIDVIAPLFIKENESEKAIGAIILKMDARDFLFPMIQSWPTISDTAETLVVRRDGDSVLFLNELRYQKDTALKLRIPLSNVEVPAVMAVLGKEGVFEGIDYRGVEVISVTKGIPNSPWFMVSKIDQSEAFATWHYRSALILVMLLGFASGTIAVFFVIWQRNEKLHFIAQYNAQRALNHAEASNKTTLMSIGDGVIVTDIEGRVKLMNAVAEMLTGWKHEEACGKPIKDVFDIVNEHTREQVENPVGKVLKEGLVVGLANSTLLISRDGVERPIADSGAPIRNESGSVSGVVLVFRDQSEERAAQHSLTHEKERARQYLDIVGVIMVALDKSANVVLINKKGCAILGYDEKDILGKNWIDNFLPENVRGELKKVFSCITGDIVFDEYMENNILRKDGAERIIAWHNSIVRNESGEIIGTLSSGEDITDRKRAEESLRESEKQLSVLSDNLAEGMVYQINSGPDGVMRCFTYVSNAVERLHELTSEDILRDPSSIYNQVVEEDRVLLLEKESKAFATRTTLDVDLRVQLPSGKVRWRRFVSKPRVISDGSILWDGIELDVTERKQSEIERQNDMARMETLLLLNQLMDSSEKEIADFALEGIVRDTASEIGFVGFISEDEKTMTIHAWSNSAMKECAVADKPMHFPIDQAGVWGEAIRLRSPISIEDYSKDHPAKRGVPAGHAKISNYLGAPIFDGKKIVAVAGLSNKKSAYNEMDMKHVEVLLGEMWSLMTKKRAEEALRESEERYRVLALVSFEGLMIHDRGIILDANPAFAELFGIKTIEELIGKNLLEVLPLTPESKSILLEQFRLKREEVFELTIMQADGVLRILETQGRNIDYKGIKARAVTIHDITDRKRLVEERMKMQRLESIGVLAGGIAHDFNNILTGIWGNIQLLDMKFEDSEDTETLQMLSESQKACKRAVGLTKQLLTFARGGQPIKTVVSLDKLIVDSCRFAASGTKIKFDYSIPNDLWQVDADEGQIHQVLNNLIINAAQAMPEGGTVTVRASNLEHDSREVHSGLILESGKYVEALIKDTGIGIKKENLSRIFDPYFTTKTHGSGLGLATSYSIVNKHNGNIIVESELGKGTTFRVYLPVSEQAAEEKSGKDKIIMGKGRILLMDDEIQVWNVAEKIVTKLGYEIEWAKDGAEAIELYKEALQSGRRYDAVILDLTIPGGMGGKQCIEKLFKLDPEVRAIVSSGYSNDPVMSDYEAYGFKGVLPKPLQIDRISEVLSYVTGKNA